MRFNELVHWSDGLFLQPHHLQEMQRSFLDYLRSNRGILFPYNFGVSDLEIDMDVINEGRVVVKRLSAIMPNGQEISIPGNTKINPLTLSIEKNTDKDIVTIYVAVPNWSEQEANLNEDNNGQRLFSTKETVVKDENTGDNEIPLLKRFINARLIESEDEALDCSILPIIKLNYVSRNVTEPKIAVVDYIPPFLVVSDDCPLKHSISELIFQLRRRRDKILSDLSENNFSKDNSDINNIFSILQLRSLNSFEVKLDGLLSTGKIPPFILYLELRSLLGELAALQPLSKKEQVAPYNHYNLLPVFTEIISNIRFLLMSDGYVSYTRIDFVENENFYELSIENENLLTNKDYYISVVTLSDDYNLVKYIESGDNFKLINLSAKQERIRGVKLEEIKNPPRYLPSIKNALWFKICTEDSQTWKDIVNEKAMAIDLSKSVFSEFSASLFITSVSMGSDDE